MSWGYPGDMAPTRQVVIQKVTGFQVLAIEGHATSVLILQHLLDVGQQINEGNRVRFHSELAGAQRRVKLLSTWILLSYGRVLLSTLNVILQ